MDVDIVCVGFGPATAGFLTTLSRNLVKEDGTPAVESAVMPGMPPQVVCYERADDTGFGVSGVVTKGRAIKETMPDFDPKQIPMPLGWITRKCSTCSIRMGRAGARGRCELPMLVCVLSRACCLFATRLSNFHGRLPSCTKRVE